jgi:hypothetical protein
MDVAWPRLLDLVDALDQRFLAANEPTGYWMNRPVRVRVAEDRRAFLRRAEDGVNLLRSPTFRAYDFTCFEW